MIEWHRCRHVCGCVTYESNRPEDDCDIVEDGMFVDEKGVYVITQRSDETTWTLDSPPGLLPKSMRGKKYDFLTDAKAAAEAHDAEGSEDD